MANTEPNQPEALRAHCNAALQISEVPLSISATHVCIWPFSLYLLYITTVHLIPEVIKIRLAKCLFKTSDIRLNSSMNFAF